MWISWIHEKETEVTQVRDMVIQRVDRVELLLKQMAKLLAKQYELCDADQRRSITRRRSSLYSFPEWKPGNS